MKLTTSLIRSECHHSRSGVRPSRQCHWRLQGKKKTVPCLGSTARHGAHPYKGKQLLANYKSTTVAGWHVSGSRLRKYCSLISREVVLNSNVNFMTSGWIVKGSPFSYLWSISLSSRQIWFIHNINLWTAFRKEREKLCLHLRAGTQSIEHQAVSMGKLSKLRPMVLRILADLCREVSCPLVAIVVIPFPEGYIM